MFDLHPLATSSDKT
jgi:hypothetical protein